MLYGVTIGNLNTLTDFDLYFKASGANIGCATVESKIEELNGKNRLLNLTQMLNGVPHYKQRTITVDLLYIGNRKNWAQVARDVERAFNGLWFDNIIFDDATLYIWQGYVTVANQPASDRLGLTLTAVCNPTPKLNVSSHELMYCNEPVCGSEPDYGFTE